MNDRSRILQDELDELKSQIGTLEQAVRVEPDFGLGEGDPAITSRQVDRALLERLKKRVETVERAISAPDEGAYGVCQKCGNPIHPDRLAVLLDTEVCARCAKDNQSA